MGEPPAALTGGIIIHLYTDVDTQEDAKIISFPYSPKKPTAESLCIEVAQRLKIGPRSFPCFALAKLDLSLWLPPNEEIQCPPEEKKEYVFRMRFIPTEESLTTLLTVDEGAFNYFFLQVRDDFVNGRMKYKCDDGKKVGQGHLLGLSVIDMLRWGKEKHLDLKQIQNNRPKTKKFIPVSEKESFKFPWDMKRLVFNLNCNLEKVYSECKDHNEKIIKRRYIIGFLNYVDQYGQETFTLSDGKKISVNPHHQQCPGIYTAYDSEPKSGYSSVRWNGGGRCYDLAASTFTIPEHKTLKTAGTQRDPILMAEVDDLMDITLQTSARTSVQINRKSGMPLMFEFTDYAVAMSFVALLDGYYRLIEDFHFNLCSSVKSELLQTLNRMGCHGPVGRDWAAKRLLDKHSPGAGLNYLLKQKSDALNIYVLMYISKDPSNMVPKVSKVQVEKTSEGYQLQKTGEPLFPSMNQLLEHYKKSGHGEIQLQSCVRPAPPVDSSLYLCRSKPLPTSSSSSGKDSGSAAAPPTVYHHQALHHHAAASLVSGVNVSANLLGKGAFTEVYEGSWDRQRGDVQKAAIKMLQHASPNNALQGLLDGLHKATFWHNSALVTVYALCLSPRAQAVLQVSPLGDLWRYFRQPQQAMRTLHLMHAAEQIAQALLYLTFWLQTMCMECEALNRLWLVACRDCNAPTSTITHPNELYTFYAQSCGQKQVEKTDIYGNIGEVHGNIRCRNVLVFFHGVEELGVKLADPGLIYFYNSLPIEHKVNIERLPWLAPESYTDLSNLSVGTDRFSYGIFLWELFSQGARPYKGLTAGAIRDNVSKGLFLSKPEQCPDQMYDIMGKCCDRNFDQRMEPKEIVREIRSLFAGAKNDVYSTPGWDDDDEDESLLINSGDLAVMQDNQINGQIMQQQQQQQQQQQKQKITKQNSEGWNDCDSREPLLIQTSSESTLTSGNTDCTELAESGTGMASVDVGSFPQRSRPLPELPGANESSREEPSIKNNFLIQSHMLQVHRGKKDELGAGFYGTVRRGTYLSKKGRVQVAVKELKADKIEESLDDFKTEMTTMAKLSHVNIVKLIGRCYPSQHDSCIMLVMEYVDNGCLRDYIKECDPAYKTLTCLLDYAKDITEGMVYLSQQNIIHRDLAARNVLVSKDRRMKIADFGLSRILGNLDDYYTSSEQKVLPVYWCAPESLHSRKFYSKSDVWSFAVTLWEMFSFGEVPVKPWKVHEILVKLFEGKRLQRPPFCPKKLFEGLMLKCWEYKYQERIDFVQALEILKRIRSELEQSGVV